jgi:hypothetical protein
MDDETERKDTSGQADSNPTTDNNNSLIHNFFKNMLTFKTVSLHFVMVGPFPFLGRIVHIPTTEFGKLHFTWCIPDGSHY